MTDSGPKLADSIPCPFCAGKGSLGVAALSRLARLTAEETFSQVTQKAQQTEDAAWQWYEADLMAQWGRNLGDGFGAIACRPVLSPNSR